MLSYVRPINKPIKLSALEAHCIKCDLRDVIWALDGTAPPWPEGDYSDAIQRLKSIKEMLEKKGNET